MSKFTDSVQQDTPRLVVTFQRSDDDELFNWGIVGKMPILTLVGYITRVQSELVYRTPDPCEPSALVIVWNATTKQFNYFIHPDIPTDSVVGMLDLIKFTLVNTHIARQMASQQQQVTPSQSKLIGPNGAPLR